MRMWITFFLFAVTVPTGCGSGADATDDDVLFDGPPGALRPHEVGRTTHFRVTARTGDESTSSLLTTRVLHEGPDGEFLIESTYDGGAARRARARETEQTIRIEAVAVEAPTGFAWLEVAPPAEVIHTPILRGEVRQTHFVRTIDAVVEIDGVPAVRPIVFDGSSTRVPRGHEHIRLGEDTVRAIAFDVRGESRLARIPGVPDPATPALRLSFRGSRHLVEGVGLVREHVHLTLSTDDADASFDITTEREPDRGRTRRARGWTPGAGAMAFFAGDLPSQANAVPSDRTGSARDEPSGRGDGPWATGDPGRHGGLAVSPPCDSLPG